MHQVYRGFVGIPFETGMRAIARRFLQQLDDARSLSQTTLEQILALNGPTEWGRRYGQTPIIDFVERKGQVINVAGEKTGEAQVARAFEAACREIGAAAIDYIVAPDPSFTPARYTLLVEALSTVGANGAAPSFDAELLLRAFERQLRRTAPDYDESRRMGELGPMLVRVLQPGAFERFRDMRVAAGASAVQVKVPHVLPDPSVIGRHFDGETLEEIV